MTLVAGGFVAVRVAGGELASVWLVLPVELACLVAAGRVGRARIVGGPAARCGGGDTLVRTGALGVVETLVRGGLLGVAKPRVVVSP